MKDIKELKDEELENVSGGSIYSGDNYWALNYNVLPEGQRGDYHPLIVTMFNSCKLHNGPCYTCVKTFHRGIIYYCSARSEENDPCK